jgi:hypothetical protein
MFVAIRVLLIFDCVSDFCTDFLNCFEGEERFAPQAIEATRHYWVNRSRIHETAAPIESHLAELSEEDMNIDISELNIICQKLFKNSTYENFSPTQKIEYYVTHVSGHDSVSYRGESLKKIAKLLIVELRKDATPESKKKEALLGIANAISHCYPRIYEQSQHQLKLLKNQVTSLDEKFKFWLQVLKENIILERYQNSQFHILNHARARLSDWGFDQNPVNFQDDYINSFSSVEGINYRYTLNREYTPARIVTTIRGKIIDEGDNTQINTYFQAHQQELSDAGLSHQDLFENDGTTISYKGAAWLLKMHNFFY